MRQKGSSTSAREKTFSKNELLMLLQNEQQTFAKDFHAKFLFNVVSCCIASLYQKQENNKKSIQARD